MIYLHFMLQSSQMFKCDVLGQNDCTSFNFRHFYRGKGYVTLVVPLTPGPDDDDDMFP